MNPERIDKLERLAKQIPNYAELLGCNNLFAQQIKMEEGTGLSVGLFKNHDCAVARTFCSAGSVFPSHTHSCREVLAVIRGEMIVRSGRADTPIEDWTETRVAQHEAITLEPNTAHRAEFPVDTWFLAMTLPGDPRWPGPMEELLDLVKEPPDAERNPEGRPTA